MREPKRLRLDPDVYGALRSQVLRRDHWKCQVCGKMTNLEVHHMRFRSRGGDDSESNLITLCARCHNSVHSRSQSSEPTSGKMNSHKLDKAYGPISKILGHLN
jgi:5-methylcytosine-specific restriction endonuclease McrA